MKLDIIGDIHGCAGELISLLEKLEYKSHDGAYGHPERSVLFIGDYIDRGSRNLETVNIVRSMVEARSARAIMGNHEYNAVAYHTPDEKNGGYFREHSTDNRNQHSSFLKEMKDNPKEAAAALEWFKTLPLFLEEHGARFVHAAWHQPTIDRIRSRLNSDNSMPYEYWRASFDKVNDEFKAVEMLLKGPEFTLPEGCNFEDKGGKIRTKVRLAWWKLMPLKIKDGTINVPDKNMLPDQYIPSDAFLGFNTTSSDPITFIGHYWESDTPIPLSPKIACVDYSVAKNGKLCCYRWDGETELRKEKFVTVPRRQ